MILEQKIKKCEIRPDDNVMHRSIQDEFKSQIANYYSYSNYPGKARESPRVRFKDDFSLL